MVSEALSLYFFQFTEFAFIFEQMLKKFFLLRIYLPVAKLGEKFASLLSVKSNFMYLTRANVVF